MARSTLSLGMLWARAAWMALRNRGLAFGSPPPVFAAMLISLDSLLKIWPRFASIAPLKRLTFDHLLCPDIPGDIFQNTDCLTSKIQRTRRENRGRGEITKRYSSFYRCLCQSRLCHCGGTPFSSRCIQNAFAQSQRFRRRFDVFIDVDVLDGALKTHAQRRFQLHAFAVAL